MNNCTMPPPVGSLVVLDTKRAAMRSALVCRRKQGVVWLYDTSWKEGESKPVTRRPGFDFDTLGIYRTTDARLDEVQRSVRMPELLENGTANLAVFGLFDYVIFRAVLGFGVQESAVFHYDASGIPERATAQGLYVTSAGWREEEEEEEREDMFVPIKVLAVMPKIYDVPYEEEARRLVQEYADTVLFNLLLPGAELTIPSVGRVFCLYNGDSPLRFPEDSLLAQMSMGRARGKWLEEDCVPRGTMIVAESGRAPPKKYKLACATLFAIYGLERLREGCQAPRWWEEAKNGEQKEEVYCACSGVPRVYRIVADLDTLGRYRIENEEGGSVLVVKRLVDSVFQTFSTPSQALAYGSVGEPPQEKTPMYRWH